MSTIFLNSCKDNVFCFVGFFFVFVLLLYRSRELAYAKLFFSFLFFFFFGGGGGGERQLVSLDPYRDGCYLCLFNTGHLSVSSLC